VKTPAGELARRKGLIISGGPSSVYDSRSPQSIRRIFADANAVLGICLRPAIDGAPAGRRGAKGR